MKILVLGVGGNVSQGIIKALRSSMNDIEIVGACISEESLGLYWCDKAYIAPYANEKAFIPWVIDICNKEAIDIILTGVEENIMVLAEHKEKLEQETDSIFISCSCEQLQIGADKLLTCEWLKANECNYPAFCSMDREEDVLALVEKMGFPLIAKPRIGKSSMGVYKVDSFEMLKKLQNTENYVLEECIGDESHEYTVGCYGDKNGDMQDIIIMHRKLGSGSTVWAEVIEDDEIRQEAEKICKCFKPIGPLNIQLRKDRNGKPVCFELNVRFSGTTPIRTQMGYCDVKAMINEYVLNQPIEECFKVRKGQVFRYVNEMYVFDDSVEKIKANGMIENIDKSQIGFGTVEGK